MSIYKSIKARKTFHTTVMKSFIKVFFAVLSVFAVLIFAAVVYSLSATVGYGLDENKLVGTDGEIKFYDAYCNEIDSSINADNFVDIADLPSYVKNAFIAVEDKRFYKHHGIDGRAMARALFNNIKSFSFREGGSTISQQLIKNTHLSNEKTIKRKLAELKLTRQLEKKYTKDEILSMYLNTIYFGENSFGIAAASETYFRKSPKDLSIPEAAILAGIIKAPSSYSPLKDAEKCLKRRNIVLRLMYEQKFIGADEYERSIKAPITVAEEKQYDYADFYLRRTKAEFDEIMDYSPYALKNCKVYTYMDKTKQQLLGELADDIDYRFSAIAIDNDLCGISAYFSTDGDDCRQVGSAIKPLAVYAPAIEENIVCECTPINDEKSDFNGYAPHNFADKYHGYISVRESLEQSSNVCAVKILNYLTPEKSIAYLKRMALPVSADDKNLALALGATGKGMTLKALTAAYTVFSNDGYFNDVKFISHITVEDNKVYERKCQKAKIFDEATCDVMNYMLESVAKNGTAKKLGALNFPVAAKTGTVGNADGNSDAYTISYDQHTTLGVRISGDLGNSVTGGGLPATKSYLFWINGGKNIPLSTHEGKTKIIKLDRISYDQDHKLVCADEYAPERFTKEGLFKCNNLPKEKSTRFSIPKTEMPIITVNKNKIEIKLCKSEYLDFFIYKNCDGNKTLVFDSKGKSVKNEFTDEMDNVGKIYEYSVIPYTDYNGKLFKGDEIFLGKIKCPDSYPDDWWLD